ncbi:MAG: D-aminoacyl-tRNA deacylase [Firmicutes bacterium]|nr:D-aminoacyl-tRNA deacylase [Bacillota bacterium]
MRAVVQRVISSFVKVDDRLTGEIGKGLMVLLGISEDDTLNDIDYMVEKITNLRIFEDDEGKMNLSLYDVSGELLVVSQFTLYGDCRKGRRPSFVKAARPEKAQEYYNIFIEKCSNLGIGAKTGVFQAEMLVNINNDGPVTLIIDSKKKF